MLSFQGGHINKEIDDTEEMAKADSPIKKKVCIYLKKVKILSEIRH